MSYIDELVDNGFFIGSDHCYDVYCAFCGIWINWCFQLGDNPKKLHKEKNLRCIVFSKKFSLKLSVHGRDNDLPGIFKANISVDYFSRR